MVLWEVHVDVVLLLAADFCFPASPVTLHYADAPPPRGVTPGPPHSFAGRGSGRYSLRLRRGLRTRAAVATSLAVEARAARLPFGFSPWRFYFRFCAF